MASSQTDLPAAHLLAVQTLAGERLPARRPFVTSAGGWQAGAIYTDFPLSLLF
ncbi:MAG: hypothetical protein Q7R50_02155 [Dehalococcoidales bacterium]|nr:hypothetical protein [Dehalococcoidales bacterium]